MQAYSLDLRARVVADREAGRQTTEVAHKYRVSPAWVRRLMQRYRASGQMAPKRRTQYQTPLLAPYQKQLQPLSPRRPTRRWPSCAPPWACPSGSPRSGGLCGAWG